MYKRLYRSQKNRMIAGVAGGIAEYFDIDPVLVRAAFIITTFGWGISLLAYIVLWIIVPNDSVQVVAEPIQNSEQNVNPHEHFEERHNGRRYVAGIILVVLGAALLLDNYIPDFHFREFWPVILIALGIIILLRSRDKNIPRENV